MPVVGIRPEAFCSPFLSTNSSHQRDVGKFSGPNCDWHISPSPNADHIWLTAHSQDRTTPMHFVRSDQIDG